MTIEELRERRRILLKEIQDIEIKILGELRDRRRLADKVDVSTIQPEK